MRGRNLKMVRIEYNTLSDGVISGQKYAMYTIVQIFIIFSKEKKKLKTDIEAVWSSMLTLKKCDFLPYTRYRI